MNKPQIVVIDYPGRRDSKHVSDMRLEDYGFDVHYSLKSNLPGELYADSYAQQLIRNPGIEFSRVVGVVGYCMAGHLAQEVAAQLTAVTGTALPLILMDSGPLLAEAVEEECRSTFAAFGGAELVAILGVASSSGLFSAHALRDNPLHTVEEIRRILCRFAMDRLNDDAANEDIFEETMALLIEYHLGWITHLIAAYNNTSPPWRGGVLHVVSRDHPFREDWPGADVTKTVVIDSTEKDLLSNATTRDSITSHILHSTRNAVTE